MHKRMKPLFSYNFSNGIVSNRLIFSLIFSFLFFAVFTPIVTPEETEEKTTIDISSKKIADVDPNTPGDQSGWAMTFKIVSGPDPGPDFIKDIFIDETPVTEHPLFKSFGKTSDDPIIYTLIVYDETPPANEDPPSDESATGNSAAPPSQPEPETDAATSTEQVPKGSTPDESSTGNTPAQQAAPQTSTDNTPTQQAASQTSTGNTPAQQAAPQTSTGNTPTDTEGTPTPDTPEQQASDLVVDALKVDKGVLDAGESFTLSAVVKNQGEESSSTGTLTYYQYFDDKSVEKVGESAIASLAAGETTDVSITLTAPETSGTHSYYACVRTNCASIVKISVRSEIKELVISSGNNQTGTPNNDLPNPISVRVLGEDGSGVPRVKVVFRVVSGDARMRRAGGPKRWRGASAWTDSEGYAKAYVTPTGSEPIRIRASVEGLDPVVFTVNPEQVGSAPSAQSHSHVTVLLANYPNPLNPETWIPYRLAKASEVVVEIFASNGQVVRRLQLGHQPAGIYQSRSRAAYWDGKNEYGEPVASGLYFYTLTAGEFTATRKMLIRK